MTEGGADMAQDSEVGDVGLRDAVLSGWFRSETNELFEGLTITRDDIVADIGCGDGFNAHFCAMRGAELILADIDPGCVAVSARRLAGTPARRVRAIVTDGNPLPLEDALASVVICTEVLEHVDDPLQFLGELVRIGRPGARYLLTVPDPVAEELQRSLAHPSYFAKPNHLRIIQREEFAELVRAAGLMVERRASYGYYWALWWLMFWSCKADLSEAGRHPILASWTRTWEALLDTPQGIEVKRVLDSFMPKSQLILARKP